MRTRTVVAGLALAAVAVAGCGVQDDYNSDRGKGDSPVGDKDDSPAAVINMPDGFANVVHKCDGSGHRVYVTRETGEVPRQLVVVADESCER